MEKKKKEKKKEHGYLAANGFINFENGVCLNVIAKVAFVRVFAASKDKLIL